MQGKPSTRTQIDWTLDLGVGCWMFLLLRLLGVDSASAAVAAAEKFSNTDCLDCHLDPTTTQQGERPDRCAAVSDELVPEIRSRRNSIAWIATQGIKDLVHESKLPPPNCASCHEKEAKEYATSIHGVSHMGASGAANCWDCHGSHDILSGQERRLAGLQTEPPADLRQVPQQSGPDEGIPDEVSGGRGAVHGQHPRPRLAEDGPDRRAVLQRLPRRPRHQARPWTANRRSTTPTSPRPAASATSDRRNLRPERPRPVARQGRQARPGLHRLPHRARGRDAQERPFQDGQRPALRQMPRGPPRTLSRHLSRQGHGPGQTERRLRRGRLLRLPRPSRRAAAVQSRARVFPKPTSSPPASNVIRAPRRVSPSTGRTPTRSTGRIIRCCTRCSSA